ncbi:MAG TPA: hypothetical protein VMT34_03780, partial [Aggregatilineales bacterium]|nr:hypothetical protein [Aggregatilineales bacterium]
MTRNRPSSAFVWAIIGTASFVGLVTLAVMTVFLGILVIIGSGRILPGVSTMGMSLNGLDASEAAAQIGTSTIALTDGSRTWRIPPA